MTVLKASLNTSNALDKVIPTAERLVRLGYPVLPCLGKSPSIATANGSVLRGNWQATATRAPTTAGFMRYQRCRLQTANIGIATGMRDPLTGNMLVAIDLDTDDASVFQSAKRLLPSAAWKRGKRGATCFVWAARVPADSKGSRDYTRGAEKIQVLGLGRQSVIPPSVHPETSCPYVWLDEAELPHVDELPTLSYDEIVAWVIGLGFTRNSGTKSKQQQTAEDAAISSALNELKHGDADIDEAATLEKLRRARLDSMVLDSVYRDPKTDDDHSHARLNLAKALVTQGFNVREFALILLDWEFAGSFSDEAGKGFYNDRNVARAWGQAIAWDTGDDGADFGVVEGNAGEHPYALRLPAIRKILADDRARHPKRGGRLTLADAATLAKENERYEAAGRMPVIYDRNAKSKMAEIAERRLVAQYDDLYVWGGALCRVLTETESRNGVTRYVAGFKRVDEAYLAARVDETIQFQTIKAQGKAHPLPTPRELCALILQRHGDWCFAKARGVISTPTLRPDGTLLDTPGFDQATGLYLVGGLDMPLIDPTPSKADAEAALGLLKSIFEETPCVDEASRSVLLSGVLTVIGRGAFPVAPGHVTTAPTAGSGKSYANELIELVATGIPPVVASTGATVEELEKRLESALLAGRPIVNIDNVSCEMKGDRLAQIVSSEALSIRILGRSELVTVENNSVILASGNNVRIVADLTRRFLMASLDARVERPELRRFGRDPKKEIMADRGRYVAAALTILIGFLHAKKEGTAKCAARLAGFEAWSDLVRSALLWLNQADPVLTLNTARASDPDGETRLAIFTALTNVFGSKPFTVKAVLQDMSASDGAEFVSEDGDPDPRISVREIILESLGVPFVTEPMKFAGWLSRQQNTITNGLRLEKAGHDSGTKAALWRVVSAG
ncbi:Bifunctional DNA primase/polymerase, N-terminal [Rhizobiales bacterium GAS113]|nr:Bifunctional DNA primase/polymerase, N-terminal [Rhizobiales bacterium GAS113]